MWTVCLCVCPNNNKLSTFLFVFCAAAASFASFSSTSCFYAALTQLHIHWLGVRWKPFRSTFSVLTRYLFCISLCFFLALPISSLTAHRRVLAFVYTSKKTHNTHTQTESHTHVQNAVNNYYKWQKVVAPCCANCGDGGGKTNGWQSRSSNTDNGHGHHDGTTRIDLKSQSMCGHNTIRRRLEGFVKGIDIEIVIESARILRRRSNGTRKANTATKVATGLTGRLWLVAVWQPWQLLRAFVYSFATKLKAHNLFICHGDTQAHTYTHTHRHECASFAFLWTFLWEMLNKRLWEVNNVMPHTVHTRQSVHGWEWYSVSELLDLGFFCNTARIQFIFFIKRQLRKINLKLKWKII